MAKHRFDPIKKDKLFNKERKARLKPMQLLLKHGLKEGDKIADIGAGNGFFAIPAAKIVKESGQVFAVDVEKIMLRDLNKRASSAAVEKNITLIKSSENRAELAEKVDFMLFSYLIHEIDDKESFLDNYLKFLKTDSKILIVEWTKNNMDEGPPKNHRIGRDELKNILENKQLKNIKIEEIDEKNYLITAEKL
ncbi:class I SAM-dependent methyltransferase [Halanaerobium sp. Z-7514]|uniref:Class I SAM-dependent methyltransferase n=1 Tax=Halanaerobium polyolivorans TaxID=2886943 RepID=A0AAW4WSK9_9FIRM|nr:methyltransferase domain-containing protein [Halanaerobium polyolivorans]MCC3144088.1 class I SAM-dependent methyltransferase [Halanaerobium polyolivorans]